MAELLRVTLFLPLAAALLLHGSRQWMRIGALIVTVVVLVLSADLVARCSHAAQQTGLAAETDAAWIGWGGSASIHFSIALDGLSLWLFALTSLLSVVAVLVSWEAIQQRAALYYRLLLALETGLLGVFVARDIILFYVFFEFTLVPLFFLIGLWGGQQRRHAAVKFFLYTLAGSLLTFLGLLAIVLWCYYNSSHDPAMRTLTFSISELTESLRRVAVLQGHPMALWLQIGIFLALFAGFAIKTPLFPLHTWLPLAHVEAPTAGSVLLAGVLLKVGTYGFARFNLPMLPEATAVLMPWLLWLSLAGVLYGALVALAQTDIKRLVAYSSVSHLGFCMLGLFAVDRLGVQGGVLQMVSHGLATGGLFAVVGMIYERFHTREIADFGDLARRMPRLAAFAMLLTLSSIALPFTAGFAGEFPLLLGVFQRGWATPTPAHVTQLRIIAVLALGGAILGAWYMLWMYQRVFFATPHARGEKRRPADAAESVRDLSLREVLCLAPLVAMVLWIGLQPRFFLDRMGSTLNDLTEPAMQAVEKEGERGERRGEREETRAESGRRRAEGGGRGGERDDLAIHHSSFIIHHSPTP